MDRKVENIRNIVSTICDIDLPHYVVYLLAYTGFDNKHSIAKISDTDIVAMERFAREVLPKLGRNEAETNELYGIYSNSKENFEIAIGHKILLKDLVDVCKTTLKSSSQKRTSDSKRCNCIKRKKRSSNLEEPAEENEKDNSEDNSENHENNEEYSEEYKNKIKDHIRNIIVKYVKKCFGREDQNNEEIETKLDNIKLVDNFNTALVPCIMCSFVSRAYSKSKPNSKIKNWTLSNYNKHLKTHFKNSGLHEENSSKHKLQNSILNYIVVNDESTLNLPDASTSSPLLSEEILHDDSNFSLDRSNNEAGTSVQSKISKSPLINSNQREIRNINKRALIALDKNQPRITEFFKVFNQVESIMEKDAKLSSYFEKNEMLSRPSKLEKQLNSSSSKLLYILKETALKNANNKKHGNRYTDPLKLFCLYIFITAGRMAYEVLYSNLKGSWPSISTINASLNDCSKIVEGVVRFAELKEFLNKRNYGNKIFISEDQTAVIRRIYYDSKQNKMIGFVLPICNDTGFPSTEKFTVTCLADIKRAFEEEDISNTAYVYMAQPLQENAPAFCLVLFGSNNKFTADDVLHRWNYLETEAKKHDIEIYGISSDGDTRCLKTMKFLSGLGTTPDKENITPFEPFFQANYNLNQPVVVQDTVHIGTKLKTRFLKPEIILPMGNFFVSPEFIKTVMKKYSKDQHFLCNSYLKGNDKMNFEAVEKLSATCVTDLLEKIPGSEATRQFLIIVKFILDSFLDKTITVSERIYKMWFSVFFFRIWKKWLQRNNFSVSKNFITSNTYTSIELNAHSLLIILEKCRNDGCCEYFLPWLFSSQPCEKIFRQTRSMTSTYSTVVNYGISDILRRLNRIQALNEISTDLQSDFKFPREENRRLGTSDMSVNNQNFPSVAEIKEVLKKCQEDVIDTCNKLGMSLNDDESCFTDVQVKAVVEKEFLVSCNEREGATVELSESRHCESDEEYYDSMKNDISILSNMEDLNLKDYSNNPDLSSHGQFLKIRVNNKFKLIRKSALIWFFSEKNYLSSDRRLRVQGMSSIKKVSDGLKKAKPLDRKTSNNKRPRKRPSTRKKENRSLESETESEIYSTETSYSGESDEMELQSDTVTETFASSDEDFGTPPQTGYQIKTIEIEKYYCVYFDEKWYIGRVIKSEGKNYTIKFLREDLDRLIWPVNEDVTTVNEKFIFYGPVNIQGNGPFFIKRSDIIQINNKYREIKKAL